MVNSNYLLHRNQIRKFKYSDACTRPLPEQVGGKSHFIHLCTGNFRVLYKYNIGLSFLAYKMLNKFNVERLLITVDFCEYSRNKIQYKIYSSHMKVTLNSHNGFLKYRNLEMFLYINSFLKLTINHKNIIIDSVLLIIFISIY